MGSQGSPLPQRSRVSSDQVGCVGFKVGMCDASLHSFNRLPEPVPQTNSVPQEVLSHLRKVLRKDGSLPRGDAGSWTLPFSTQGAHLHPGAGRMEGAEVAGGG